MIKIKGYDKPKEKEFVLELLDTGGKVDLVCTVGDSAKQVLATFTEVAGRLRFRRHTIYQPNNYKLDIVEKITE